MSRTILKGSRTDRIRTYIYENTGCSASPQGINRKLNLGISASSMRKKIKHLCDNYQIYEVNGRFYHWEKLPEELEKYT